MTTPNHDHRLLNPSVTSTESFHPSYGPCSIPPFRYVTGTSMPHHGSGPSPPTGISQALAKASYSSRSFNRARRLAQSLCTQTSLFPSLTLPNLLFRSRASSFAALLFLLAPSDPRRSLYVSAPSSVWCTDCRRELSIMRHSSRRLEDLISTTAS
jgi:hypothetical protein